MWLVILIILAIIIVIAVIKINEIKKENERQKLLAAEKAEKEREKQERRKQARKTYWNNLPSVYANKSQAVLKQALSLLQTMDRYHCEIGDPNFASKTDIWADANNKLTELLNYPKWKYGNTESYISDQAIWYDLDMKYIKNLLNR